MTWRLTYCPSCRILCPETVEINVKLISFVRLYFGKSESEMGHPERSASCVNKIMDDKSGNLINLKKPSNRSCCRRNNNWFRKINEKRTFSFCFYFPLCYSRQLKSCFRGISEFRIFAYLLATSTLIKLARVGYHRRRMPGLRLVSVGIGTWILFTAMLMRPYNVILLGSLVITTGQLNSLLKLESNTVMKIVIAHHWLAHVYFYYQVIRNDE